MPIVSKKPTAAPEYRPHIPRVELEKLKSIVVDTKYTPRSSLLKYTEGAIWTVDYYSQYHDKDNATRSEEHTSELQSLSDLVCRLLLEKKNT